MYRQLEVTIEGVVPCLMNNGRKANPIDPYATAMRKITKSKGRGEMLTEDQALVLAKLEFMGALYTTDKGEPCWPGENIEAMILSAAKKKKQGPKVKIGLMVDGNWSLEYDGPKDPEKLWDIEASRKMCMARVQGKPVMRCRPIFFPWRLTFIIHFDPEFIDVTDLQAWLEIAGAQIGLSDWRPKFGRFIVLSMRTVE